MGCTNSVDGNEPSSTRKLRSTMNKQEQFKELDETDKQRIKLILDYWYDEGGKNGSDGNSKDYIQLMKEVRSG